MFLWFVAGVPRICWWPGTDYECSRERSFVGSRLVPSTNRTVLHHQPM